MDTNTVFLAILVVIGFAIATVWFDRFMHNRERPNFAAGVTITAFAICGFLILFNGHHNLTHKATTLILFALILFVLAGNLLIDKNNIDDQEGGLMSKWGTWWDSGDDNYFSNIIDKWQTWAFICVVGWLMFSVAVNRDIDDDNAAIAATTSNAVVAKTHLVNAKVIGKESKSKKAQHTTHKHEVVRNPTRRSQNK